MNLGDHGDLTLRNAPEQQMRDLTVRALQIRAGSIDEAQRSIEMILATEGTAQVFDMRSFQVIDEVLRMDGCDMPAQMPLLADHNRYSIEAVRGSIRNLRVEGTNLIGRAFFADDEDSLRAWSKVKQGHLTDVSAGYRVTAAIDIPAGMTQDVAGRTYTAGQRALRVSTRWAPKEGSLVPIGADPAAKFREDPNPTTNRATAPDQDRPMFKQWLKARGLDHDSLTDGQRSALLADFNADQARTAAATAADAARAAAVVPAPAPAAPAPAAAPAPVVSESERATGMRLERERCQAIRAAGAGLDAELVERAIVEGWDVSRAHAEFLTAMRAARRPAVGGDRDDRGAGATNRGEPAIEVLVANEDKFVRAATTALMQRAGAEVGDRDEMTGVQLRAEAAGLRGIGLQDLARLSLRAHRQDVPINAETLFKRAVSSYSFPTALGSSLYRTLLSGYETAPSTILQWAASMDVNDFRVHKAIKLGKFARPEKVGKAGNATHGTTNEEAESFSADTWAQKFVLTRQDFINDDLGIFTRIPMELGASMKMNIDDIGYTDVLVSAAGLGPTMAADSTALFNASRSDGSNYSTGSTLNLQSSSLTTLKTLFRKLKQNGRPLNLMPVVLLVPPELEQTALELVKSTNIVISQAGSTDASTVRGSTNIHSGTLQVIVEPRLSAGTNGTTAWYLIADPIRAKSLAVSFLKGQATPSVERKDPAEELAMGWLAYHDVGVSAVDWRGIVRSKGAA